MAVVAVIEVDKYNKWMIGEYKDQFSITDCYEAKDGTYKTKWCEIETYKGDKFTIPKGLSGRFDDLKTLRSVLVLLVKKIDEYDPAGDPITPDGGSSDDDIPF